MILLLIFCTPILGFAVIFHFVMGFVLELKNRSARPVKYAMNNGSANSTWMSRNMIISGLVVLAFLGLHMYDFWWHEINFKYVEANTPDNERFWHELHAKFADAWRVIFYIIAFVLLGLHLAHGFQSSFQSVGARHPKYTPVIKALGLNTEIKFTERCMIRNRSKNIADNAIAYFLPIVELVNPAIILFKLNFHKVKKMLSYRKVRNVRKFQFVIFLNKKCENCSISSDILCR